MWLTKVIKANLEQYNIMRREAVNYCGSREKALGTIEAMWFVDDRSKLVIIPRSVSTSTVGIISPSMTDKLRTGSNRTAM